MSHLESGQLTNATFDYLFSPGHEVAIHYTYPGQSYSMDYGMNFSGGNIVAFTSFVSGQISETGHYDYNLQTNPYAQMNWPDVYLSSSLKNNMLKQDRTYQLHMPAAEPYHFSYTYDADGYPKELVKKFRSVSGSQHTKTTETVVSY